MILRVLNTETGVESYSGPLKVQQEKLREKIAYEKQLGLDFQSEWDLVLRLNPQIDWNL